MLGGSHAESQKLSANSAIGRQLGNNDKIIVSYRAAYCCDRRPDYPGGFGPVTTAFAGYVVAKVAIYPFLVTYPDCNCRAIFQPKVRALLFGKDRPWKQYLAAPTCTSGMRRTGYTDAVFPAGTGCRIR